MCRSTDQNELGEYLKRKYNGATHVMIDQGGSGIVVANHHFKKPTRKDLVYMEASPDYCVQDLSIGESTYLRTFFLTLTQQYA